MNRVSPFRKGIGRFTTAPVESPHVSLLAPSPDRRSAGPGCRSEADHVPLRVGLRSLPALAQEGRGDVTTLEDLSVLTKLAAQQDEEA